MLVDFNSLPEDSRIWIYQSNRKFSDDEISELNKRLSEFLIQWTAHGTSLEAGFELKHNRFIVIGLNQESASASGCSIDASVHFIQQLEKQFQVDLLDKMNVTFYTGEFITHKTLQDFKQMAKSKAISKKTIVFNNLINTKSEYLENWEVPAEESWHTRFF
ncbi:ABC transporter ATPase [uncultured Planktosalinus sp.]|uniref:ABC transporter ATPase n=1 Tax=uncultured Planktosalinus sp. TaxID=1810935 RepID=UPI0030D74D31